MHLALALTPEARKVGWTLAGSLFLHLAALAWLPSWGETRAFASPPVLQVQLAAAPAASEAAAPSPTPAAARPRPPRLFAAPARPASPSAAGESAEPAAPPPALPPSAASTTVTAAAPAPTPPDLPAAYQANPPPPYPRAARRLGVEGRVVLRVEVLADGRCGEIALSQSSGHAVLDAAALEVVKGWRFVPATRAGQAVAAWVEIPISFRLDGREG